MSKRIVVCIDGTNNDPLHGRTNVSRFFRMLAKTPGEQIAYYQPGVGTLDPDSDSASFILWTRRVWDLATAWRIRRHVTSACRYLMETFEDDDTLHLIGFSRGAYTCRVLAGMLTKVGLLQRGHEEMVDFAWEIYKPPQNFEAAARFKQYFSRGAEVSFLGLWDTVRSVGTPWRPKVFPHTFNNPGVSIVRHALALDERRAMYPSNLWTAQPSGRQDVQQVWFPGVHADVGGGYTGDEHPGIGAIPLFWMVREAERAGLTFDPDEKRRAFSRNGQPLPQPPTIGSVTADFATEPTHDEISAHWYWRCLEHLPLPRWVPDGSGGWERQWGCHRARPRSVPDHTWLHESIRHRMLKIPDYQPVNLPSPVPPDRFVW